MKLRETYHRGGGFGQHSDTVIYAPYPWSGNDSNSHARYAAVAERSGFDVVTMSVAGTGRIIIDRATKKSLNRVGIKNLAHEEAIRAETITSDYAQRVGLGDSGRGLWIAAMQASGVEPFSHVVVRDGVNMHAPEKCLQGVTRLLLNAGDAGDELPNAPSDNQTALEMLRSHAEGIAELWNHTRLMCGPASVNAMFGLARSSDVPVLNVGLGHGIGGTLNDMEYFTNNLVAIRHAADGRAPFVFQAEPHWGHAMLMDPDGTIGHIKQVLA